MLKNLLNENSVALQPEVKLTKHNSAAYKQQPGPLISLVYPVGVWKSSIRQYFVRNKPSSEVNRNTHPLSISIFPIFLGVFYKMLVLTLGRQIQILRIKKCGIEFSILYSILCILPSLVLYLLAATVSAETEEKKDGKALSVFNVVREVII